MFIPMPNTTLDYDGFYISYNEKNKADYGDVTTAIVVGQMEQFFVLNGDHREAYKKLASSGLNACVGYFKDNEDLINKYSDKLKED